MSDSGAKSETKSKKKSNPNYRHLVDDWIHPDDTKQQAATRHARMCKAKKQNVEKHTKYHQSEEGKADRYASLRETQSRQEHLKPNDSDGSDDFSLCVEGSGNLDAHSSNTSASRVEGSKHQSSAEFKSETERLLKINRDNISAIGENFSASIDETNNRFYKLDVIEHMFNLLYKWPTQEEMESVTSIGSLHSLMHKYDILFLSDKNKIAGYVKKSVNSYNRISSAQTFVSYDNFKYKESPHNIITNLVNISGRRSKIEYNINEYNSPSLDDILLPRDNKIKLVYNVTHELYVDTEILRIYNNEANKDVSVTGMYLAIISLDGDVDQDNIFYRIPSYNTDVFVVDEYSRVLMENAKESEVIFLEYVSDVPAVNMEEIYKLQKDYFSKSFDIDNLIRSSLLNSVYIYRARMI